MLAEGIASGRFATGWSWFGLAALLVPAAFVATGLATASLRPAGPGRLRESLLIAAVLAGAWIVLGTELLSVVNAVRFWPLVAWWAIPLAAAAAIAGLRRHRLRGLFALPRNVRGSAWIPVIIIAATGLVIVAALVVAAIAPPHTPDGLTYHMPRQVYWMQQHSIRHFPTTNTLQTAMPPMAEFAGLHLMVLSQSEFYANLVQWLALALAAAAASLLARELGAGPLGQAMAAFILVANPMVWLQATSAKNDLLTALWLLILAAWAVRIVRDGRCDPGRWLLIGAAAGLAVHTKLTGAMFAMPMLLAPGFWLLARRRILTAAALATTVLLLVLAINTPHWYRNWQVYDSLTATERMRWGGDKSHDNETHSPTAIASNLVRNIGLHVAVPLPRANTAVESAIAWMHRRAGVDLNDPRTTAYRDFKVVYAPGDESKAGAPVHLLVIILGLVVIGANVIAAARQRPLRWIGIPAAETIRLSLLAAAGLLGLLLFCALLKWQPWHARLHMGLIALLGTAAAAAICRGTGRGVGAMALVGLLSVPLLQAMLWNPMRPLIGERSIFTSTRDEMMVRGRIPQVRIALDEAERWARVTEARTIGMRIRLEYAFQSQLMRELSPRPYFTTPLAPADTPPLKRWPAADLFIDEGGQFPRFRDRSSGEMLYLVGESGAYRFFVPMRIAERLLARGVIGELPR